MAADLKILFLLGRMIEGVSNLIEGKDTDGDGLDDMDAPQDARDRCALLPRPILGWAELHGRHVFADVNRIVQRHKYLL